MAILDHNGRPVEVSKLTREQATGSIMQVRNPFDPEVALGMTPERLRILLSNARAGDHSDYLALAHEMEQRDAHYYSTLQTRKLAIFALPEQVQAASESAEDEAIADGVRDFVGSAEFKLAILDILDSLGKGFSCVEVVWETSESQWRPDKYIYRNPRWFKFDNATAQELRLVDGTIDGAELDPYKYIIHKPKIVSGLALAGGLARIVAALHLFKGYALKDWMAFAEVFGMPIRIGKYAEGASEVEKDALKRAVRDIGNDAAAIIPSQMEIIFERANASGNAGSDRFFATLADWMNKAISKAVLGQTMTVEDGSSLAQANIHNEVRLDIRNADALQFINTINRDLIQPFVDLNYGPRRRGEYPVYGMETEEPEDLAALATALTPFIDRGLPVMQKTILDKFGLPEPEEGAELLAIPAPAGGGDPEENKEDEESKDDEKASNKLRAFKAWLDVEANRNTNMRTFRKSLGERMATL